MVFSIVLSAYDLTLMFDLIYFSVDKLSDETKDQCDFCKYRE